MAYFETTHTTYNPEPDFTRPRLELSQDVRNRMLQRLRVLYPHSAAQEALAGIERILQVFHAHKPIELMERERNFNPAERFTERDVILITYGDLLYKKRQSPLKTLGDFCDSYLRGSVNTIHILPFFPSSSDRGFSVIDFETVDPLLGSWRDIEALEAHYQLMFDGVINHISSKNRWFVEFLAGNPDYEDFFIWFASEEELTHAQRRMIFRPRTTPILTRYETLKGPRYVWTTFSPDQIDLNYKNPKVLLRVLEILLFYVRQGADILRLDAVTYLWEQPGTKCIHLEQTHDIIKLLRHMLSVVAPHVALVTETNVPHKENIAYFGNGGDEAHMIYNFALPPLVLHTFYTEDARVLSEWAESLTSPSETATFFNFLDSHDGIGLPGAKNILSPEDIDRICRRAADHGGFISYKTSEDGTEVPYEVNMTWYSALNKKKDGDSPRIRIKRFIASRAIALVLQGVPGIYLHSLFGTHNDHSAVEATRGKRGINRSIADLRSILRSMNHPKSKKYRINLDLGKMIKARTGHRAFHPNGSQKILFPSTAVFALMRTSPEGDRTVLTLTNVTRIKQRVEIAIEDVKRYEGPWQDLLSEKKVGPRKDKLLITLQPYEVLWLTPQS
ncbi:MAG: alpha-glucosidase C-terminal domain-containing protein [Deltaproteobacteria bacterium]|nr:alpha-glucosidase C-terminal domain-containing protein [Deltaproteobacteria bacterium]